MTMWMVRAERKGVLFDSFIEGEIVAIGWSEIGDFTASPNLERMIAACQRAFPENTDFTNKVAAGQVYRFITELAEGDHVVTYDPSRRVYAVGVITGSASYRIGHLADGEHSWPNVRPVKWIDEVKRDDLSQPARNTLGSLLTLFQLKPSVESEILSRLKGTPVPSEPADDDPEAAGTEIDMEERSIEFISDMVARLSPNQMEEFVAGLLRAMGYATRISPPGPDRGEDIRATPDALGLQDPRIIVEVKHRAGAIGAPDLRGFLGGRHSNDKGLYVSTGGFTKDARYEAARANIPLQLLTLEDLVELVVQYYDRLDVETRAMVPLKRIYWPIL